MPPITPHAEVNEVLQELMEGLSAILGSQLAGVYLYGSLTSAEFDRQSDIDVLVATRDEMSDEVFATLAAMHDKIAAGDSWCATQLEVAYVPVQTLRRYDAKNSVYPHMDRGNGERLQRKEHWSDCVVQRHVLRERGITLVGPDPALIDPVSEDDLRQAMRDLLSRWGESLLSDPSQLERRGSQSYVVLSICRMLYTLETGAVASKRQAADWATTILDDKWVSLVDRAWAGRQNPDSEATLEDVDATLDLMRYAIRTSTYSGHPRTAVDTETNVI
jgi:predicted nucleotidyltransferase/DNA-binding transcriptional MerR regulator